MNLFFMIFSYVWVAILTIPYFILAVFSVKDMISNRKYIKDFGLDAFAPSTNAFLIINIFLIFIASILCFAFMNFK